MKSFHVGIADIQAAASGLADMLSPTPLLRNDWLSW
jgi:hypothetical protein